MMLKAPFDLSPVQTTPTYPRYCVRDWVEANQKVAELTADGTRALGSGSHYPEDYTLMYHDAWSSGCTGYTVWRNRDGKHSHIHAVIDIVRGAA